MSRSKDAWLREGAGDLREADVDDVPVKGESVRVRGLPAAYSNQASSEALELKTIGREQIATVNTARLEVLQFAHGVIDPTFTVQEAEKISEAFGPAFKKVIAKVDELSGVNKDEIEAANSRFQGVGTGEGRRDVDNGTSPGDGGPDVPARTSNRTGQKPA